MKTLCLCLLAALSCSAATYATIDATGRALTVAPTTVRMNGIAYQMRATTITLPANATGSASVYVTSQGKLGVLSDMPGLDCVTCAISVFASGDTAAFTFPLDGIALFTWRVDAGVWTTQVSDYRPDMSMDSITFGDGFDVIRTATATLVRLSPVLDTAPVPVPVPVPVVTPSPVITGSGTVDFGGLDTWQCNSWSVQFQLAGAVPGDAVSIGLPFSVPVGLMIWGRIIAKDYVNLYVCNMNAYHVTVNNALIRAAVVHVP